MLYVRATCRVCVRAHIGTSNKQSAPGENSPRLRENVRTARRCLNNQNCGNLLPSVRPSICQQHPSPAGRISAVLNYGVGVTQTT